MAEITQEEFQALSYVEITFKTGDKVLYRLSQETLDQLAKAFRDFVGNINSNRAGGGIYDVYTEDGWPRKLVLDFREVRFIG